MLLSTIRKWKAIILCALLSISFISTASAEEAARDGSEFWRDAYLNLRFTYYARDRNNYGTESKASEIDVDALGWGLDFRSGYAWGLLGFDGSLALNVGKGQGNSEVLLYDSNENKDSSSASFREAAIKLRYETGDFGTLSLRGGFTPIRVGTIGTSGGVNPHGYRGFESKWRLGRAGGARNFEIGYGWADRFHNDWDDRFREMTNMWHQNRDGHQDGRRIDYIHSLGLRYEFGPEDAAFVDVGVGEGKGFRKNAQIAASYPFVLSDGTLTLTGYYIWGKYERELASHFADDPDDEYHFSASAAYSKGPWTLFAGYGQTRARDGLEMQFRLTPWGNSDNRNYIQTWAQLDDFVWDGEKVVKVSVAYDLSEVLLPGLRLGASFNYGWDIESYDERGTLSAKEFDLSLEYLPTSERFQGWSFGVYPAWLRFEDDNFYGKHSRDDVKFIIAYNTTLNVRDFSRNRQ